MSLELPGALVREALLLAAAVGGPLLGVVVAAGLVMGVLQAATQVNDAAVGFVPRAAAAALALWLLGGWMMDRLARFLARCVEAMGAR